MSATDQQYFRVFRYRWAGLGWLAAGLGWLDWAGFAGLGWGGWTGLGLLGWAGFAGLGWGGWAGLAGLGLLVWAGFPDKLPPDEASCGVVLCVVARMSEHCSGQTNVSRFEKALHVASCSAGAEPALGILSPFATAQSYPACFGANLHIWRCRAPP